MRKKNPDAWPWYRHRQSHYELPLPFKPTPLEFFWVLRGCQPDTCEATLYMQGYTVQTIIQRRQAPTIYSEYYGASNYDAIMRYATIREKHPLQPWPEMSYELQVVEI